MLERYTRLLHNLCPEANDVFRACLALFFVSVSASDFQCGRRFLTFGSADADALFSGKSWLAMEGSDTPSTLTCSSLLTSPDPDKYDEHNMWNPMFGLFCHEPAGAFMEAYFEEADLGRIALSCDFALDVPCDKAEAHCPDECSIGTIALGASLHRISIVKWHHCRNYRSSSV